MLGAVLTCGVGIALSMAALMVPERFDAWRIYAFGVGVIFFMLAYLISSFRHASKIETLVLERTAELQAANLRLLELGKIKDEFVAVVSHELRTPIAVMREGICQMQEGVCGPITLEQQATIAITLRNLERLRELVEDMLDISKIEAGKIVLQHEKFDFIQLVREIQNSFLPRSREKEIGLELHLPGPHLWVRADRAKLAQVLTNLVSNAIKFTDQGEVRVTVEEDAQQIRCAVSDSGIGISDENMPKLFQKFQQFTRLSNGEKGSGLGLAICRGLIDLHQGRLWAESSYGKGSRFIFSIPKGENREPSAAIR